MVSNFQYSHILIKILQNCLLIPHEEPLQKFIVTLFLNFLHASIFSTTVVNCCSIEGRVLQEQPRIVLQIFLTSSITCQLSAVPWPPVSLCAPYVSMTSHDSTTHEKWNSPVWNCYVTLLNIHKRLPNQQRRICSSHVVRPEKNSASPGPSSNVHTH